jgi:hypothetical protein
MPSIPVVFFYISLLIRLSTKSGITEEKEKLFSSKVWMVICYLQNTRMVSINIYLIVSNILSHIYKEIIKNFTNLILFCN